ncbi:MAG: ATP-binding protein [Paracoccus sp. (in: a-proteobacteria)]|nr:ATP-binding protein [Paracoccus sp. (in: a-proteobacteria)]
MAHWDEQIGLPRGAIAFLPVLMAPMAFGALVLLVVPGHVAGVTAVVFSTVAVAWYLLGGAVSAAHLLRGIAARRSLTRIRAEVLASPEAVWICDPNGVVQLQNHAATGGFGDLTGRRIPALIATSRADAEGVISDLTARAWRLGLAEMSLNDDQILSVAMGKDAPLQIWTVSRKPPQMAAPASGVTVTPDDPHFDSLPVALLKLDRDGHVRRANRAARRLIPGLHQQPLLGSLMDGPGRPIGDWVADVCDGRAGGKAEMLRLRDGVEQYFQVALAPDASDPAAVVAVLHDASALKTLEAQFVQSQKMQAIGQLAGGVAHDFNNLLTAITGHCDLLMLRHDKADPDFADLDQISQNANRAAALVGQLLAFSRKQTLKPQVIDLRDALSDLRHLLNRLVDERIVLSIYHAPRLRAIRADRRQLEQVIMNLVVNARDAMPDGGDIQVRTRNLHFAENHVWGRASVPAGHYVEVQVQDEGTGMPPEIAEKIFEPFFTTKRTGEGTGLGLSTAYGIVKQTGGYIFCDSTPGEGTCFTLLFPAHDHEHKDIQQTVESSRPSVVPPPARNATVLLVEDEAAVRAFAVRALKLKGYDVLEAASAETALEILSDDRLSVDVFVTDVVMPGMDGPSWVRTALIDRPQTRVVFMSGYTEDIFGEGHAPVPNSVFLAKPFTLAELTETVARHLAGESEPTLH